MSTLRSPACRRLFSLAALVTCAALAPLAAGCGGASVPVPRAAKGSDANPLGPSYVLVPLPTEDDSLLGRMLPGLPEPGRSLEETARANPCADKLSEAKQTPLASTFEDAQELAVGAKARATLGTFGFSGDVERATHFVYKLETQKRAARSDTAEYDACCKEKGCGYGYVSALIYGEGEYATGEETSASASVDVAMASGGGQARLKILHKRKVRGWLAAVVTVTDRSKGDQFGPLGVAVAAGITEATVPETVKALYEKDKITVQGSGTNYVFRDGRGETIAENAFVRRFRNVTGSDELDDVERRRNATGTYVTGGLAAASALVTAWGIINLRRPCQASDFEGPFPDCGVRAKINEIEEAPVRFDKSETVVNPPGIVALGVGALGTLGFGTWFAIKLFSPDGSDTDHLITDRDAVLYSNRYNRSLLRKTVKDVEKAHTNQSRIEPRWQWRPTFGLGTLGVEGRF